VLKTFNSHLLDLGNFQTQDPLEILQQEPLPSFRAVRQGGLRGIVAVTWNCELQLQTKPEDHKMYIKGLGGCWL
jgi:hypothetical protein